MTLTRSVRRLRHTSTRPPVPMTTPDLNPMPTPSDTPDGRSTSPWRIAAWSAAASLLLIPLIAMQVTNEVNWTLGDFVFAAVLILGVGIPLDLVMRKTGDMAYRVGAVLALGTAFLTVWVNVAVGIIGSENDAVNLLFFAVLAIGIVGALVARFRPLGMARAMAATAVAQAAVAIGALVAGWTSPSTDRIEIVALWVFVALWVGAAVLFRASARRVAVASAA